MPIKKILLVASMLLAFGSVSSWAASHEKAVVDEEEAKCITQAEVDAMTDEGKSKVTIPICDEATAAAMEEKEEEEAKSD